MPNDILACIVCGENILQHSPAKWEVCLNKLLGRKEVIAA